MNNINAISPLDGRYAAELTALQPLVSEYALMKYRLIVEIEWFRLLFSHWQELNLERDLTTAEQIFLHEIIANFTTTEACKVKAIEQTIKHDVKALEYYIKQQFLTQHFLAQYSDFIHFACTSEDINNISYALMLKDIKNTILLPAIHDLLAYIQQLAQQYRDIAMIARTHGQAASPTTMGKELYNYCYRLQRQTDQLTRQEILGKINGAVGNYNAHLAAYPAVDWQAIAQQFIQAFELTFNPFTTQIEPHDYQAEFYDNLRRINIILIDFARDMWGYISLNYFTQQLNLAEVGSSTMPHKINPINFEKAEGNLGLANSIFGHLAEKLPISRYQRDLTDSTVQRNIGVGVGYMLLGLQSLLQGLKALNINKEALATELAQHWELLAEPVQVVMRKHGISNGYEQLKTLTRGTKLNKATLHEFIQQSALPTDAQQTLLALTPATYIGLAAVLVPTKR